MHLPNDILALHQPPGLSENDAASIDHLPGSKSLNMQVRHWEAAPNSRDGYMSFEKLWVGEVGL